MKCPKCGFEQPEGGAECIKCGIVIRKYLSGQRKDPAVASTASADTSNGAGLKELFFSAGDEPNIVSFTGRVIFLLLLIAWGMKFILTPVGSNYAGESFMHLINLPFHEAGHVLFRIFGRFMSALGGSLMQLIVPFVCLVTFLLKTGDAFAASASLWWLAESLIDLAPYIDDARSLQLILIGGVTGRDVEDFHDWEFILRKTGMLEYDHLIAGTAHVAGILLMLCSFAWGGFLLYRQFRGMRSGWRA